MNQAAVSNVYKVKIDTRPRELGTHETVGRVGDSNSRSGTPLHLETKDKHEDHDAAHHAKQIV